MYLVNGQHARQLNLKKHQGMKHVQNVGSTPHHLVVVSQLVLAIKGLTEL